MRVLENPTSTGFNRVRRGICARRHDKILSILIAQMSNGVLATRLSSRACVPRLTSCFMSLQAELLRAMQLRTDGSEEEHEAFALVE